MNPFLSGGEMIKTVTKQQVTFNDLPWKFEGGTSNIAQVIGLGAALDYLNKNKSCEYAFTTKSNFNNSKFEISRINININPKALLAPIFASL